ncbi:MAG: hypothetical protein RBU45_23515 [Myxococcota bacterium]|nr:hypothetical protein [Myxococcota bacterium]
MGHGQGVAVRWVLGSVLLSGLELLTGAPARAEPGLPDTGVTVVTDDPASPAAAQPEHDDAPLASPDAAGESTWPGAVEHASPPFGEAAVATVAPTQIVPPNLEFGGGTFFVEPRLAVSGDLVADGWLVSLQSCARAPGRPWCTGSQLQLGQVAGRTVGDLAILGRLEQDLFHGWLRLDAGAGVSIATPTLWVGEALFIGFVGLLSAIPPGEPRDPEDEDTGSGIDPADLDWPSTFGGFVAAGLSLAPPLGAEQRLVLRLEGRYHAAWDVANGGTGFLPVGPAAILSLALSR